MQSYIPYLAALIIFIIIRLQLYRYQNALDVEFSWHQHIAHCSFSTEQYYSLVEEIIVTKGIPNTYIKLVALYETSWFSRRRLYMRITDGETIFLICAFNFGDDFFISYNRGKRPSQKEINEQGRSYFQADKEVAFTESIHKIVLRSVDLISKKYGERITGNNTFNATLN